MFTLANSAGRQWRLAGIDGIPFDIGHATAKFDLELQVVDDADGLQAVLIYSLDLYEAETVQRLLGHLEQLLKGVVADLDRPITEIAILCEAEREQLLTAWNETSTDYQHDEGLQ